MKAIVTGGAGFIGSHLCDRLIADGHNVIAIDNLSGGKQDNVKHLLGNSKFNFIYADTTRDLNYLFEGVDTVFNLAASKKNICLQNPTRDLEVNGAGTLNLLQLSVKHGVKKFVHASTGSVYGNVTPQVETTMTVPVSYYGISKLAGENYVRLFNEQFGLDATVLRYFHVYGSRQEDRDSLGGVIAIFIRRIMEGKPLVVYGDGTQTRCFTYVKDVVNANIKAMDTTGIYNCVSDTMITLNDMIALLFKLTGKNVPVIYQDWQIGDIKDFAPSNDKIKYWGLQFTDFETGLQETLNESCGLYS